MTTDISACIGPDGRVTIVVIDADRKILFHSKCPPAGVAFHLDNTPDSLCLLPHEAAKIAAGGTWAVSEEGVVSEIPPDPAMMARQTIRNEADAAITAGIDVVFASFPDLSGTFGLDAETLNEIGSVARDAGSGNGLPFGADFFSYPTLDHTAFKAFDAAQVQSLYQAMRDYTALVRYYQAGQLGALPVLPVTIP